MLACVADKLVAETHKQGKNQKSDKGVCHGMKTGQHSLDDKAGEDAKQDHEEHKGCAATGVEACVLSRILGGKLLTGLEAGDRLVLCAVVHECTLDVGHQRNGRKVANEYSHLHSALKDCADGGRHSRTESKVNQPVNAGCKPNGQEDEEQGRETKAEQQRNNHYNVGDLCAELVGKPLFKLGGLLLLKAEGIGRRTHGLKAHDH